MQHKLACSLALALLLSAPALAADGAAKPKKPIATIQPEPSVHVEQGDVLTIAPIRGEGMPDQFAITGKRAYELLRNEALGLRAHVRLYRLDTGMHGLSPAGAASGWFAEFLTDTPGELLTVSYEEGEMEEPYLSTAPDRPGVPEPDAVGYDTKKLVEETMHYADGVVDPITRITASLYRSAGDGKALWLLDVYGDDDRIGQTVVFEAKTMKYSHKTR